MRWWDPSPALQNRPAGMADETGLSDLQRSTARVERSEGVLAICHDFYVHNVFRTCDYLPFNGIKQTGSPTPTHVAHEQELPTTGYSRIFGETIVGDFLVGIATKDLN